MSLPDFSDDVQSDELEQPPSWSRAAFQGALRAEMDALFEFIDEKNRKYGNSAIEPVRVFSKADPAEQLRVRMDDKLSRIRSGAADDNEDPYLDLLGYLVLERVQKRLDKR